MSKLATLRAGKPAQATIFSNNVNPAVADVFKRVQEGKFSPNGSRQNKKWKPSRFRCGKNETKRLVILDEKINHAQAEHSVKDDQGKWQTELCISAVAACPICSLPKHNPSDKILLTVLDLTPWSYTDEKTGEVVEKEFTKRELAIGTKQFAVFNALAAANNGNLRGLMLDMTRGDQPLEPGHGAPTFVQTLTEEELVEAFGHPAIEKEGRVVKQENADITPFDYAKIHVLPSRAELSQKYGIAPRPGSTEELEAEVEEETTSMEDSVNALDLDEELPEIE